MRNMGASGQHESRNTARANGVGISGQAGSVLVAGDRPGPIWLGSAWLNSLLSPDSWRAWEFPAGTGKCLTQPRAPRTRTARRTPSWFGPFLAKHFRHRPSSSTHPLCLSPLSLAASSTLSTQPRRFLNTALAVPSTPPAELNRPPPTTESTPPTRHLPLVCSTYYECPEPTAPENRALPLRKTSDKFESPENNDSTCLVVFLFRRKNNQRFDPDNTRFHHDGIAGGSDR
jgi:hypothetical protein